MLRTPSYCSKHSNFGRDAVLFFQFICIWREQNSIHHCFWPEFWNQDTLGIDFDVACVDAFPHHLALQFCGDFLHIDECEKYYHCPYILQRFGVPNRRATASVKSMEIILQPHQQKRLGTCGRPVANPPRTGKSKVASLMVARLHSVRCGDCPRCHDTWLASHDDCDAVIRLVESCVVQGRLDEKFDVPTLDGSSLFSLGSERNIWLGRISPGSIAKLHTNKCVSILFNPTSNFMHVFWYLPRDASAT